MKYGIYPDYEVPFNYAVLDVDEQLQMAKDLLKAK